MNDDVQETDPAAILRTIDADRESARTALAPNAQLLYATWGIAWIVGFLAVSLAFVPVDEPLIPLAASIAVAAAALVAAIVVSTVHSVRKNTGSRGPSMVHGAIFGNLFPVGFALTGLLGWRLTSGGVPPEAMLAYWVAVPCLIIGLLSAAGALLANDRSQLVFGIWILVVGLGSLALTPPYTLLAGAAGGVGFVALAIVERARPALTSGPITRGSDG